MEILRFAQDDRRFAQDDRRFAQDDRRFAQDDRPWFCQKMLMSEAESGLGVGWSEQLAGNESNG